MCICGKCNTIRPKKINTKPINSVLNPCTEDVENLIFMKYVPGFPILIQALSTDILTLNTVELLESIHNGKNSRSTSYIQLREIIASEISSLIFCIDYLNEPAFGKYYLEQVTKRLSRQSAFFAIKNTFIKENNPELLDLLAE